MTGKVTQILRHPIKAHGREAVPRVALAAGETMPLDRTWAVAHANAKADLDGSEWASCANFSRAAKAPGLMAIEAQTSADGETVTLKHPDLGTLVFRPDHDGDKLIAWCGELIPDNRSPSARVLRGVQRGFTDSGFPSVTLCNMASHRAVEQRVGKALSIHRWRGNLWFDGLAPWEEFDWIDREVRIGTAIVLVRERMGRCLATHANPETGQRDADVLGALDTWGHSDFSVGAEVVRSGEVAVGDAIGLA